MAAFQDFLVGILTCADGGFLKSDGKVMAK